MFKVKRGNIQAVCYTQSDVDNYIRAGWKLVEETTTQKVEEPKVEETKVEETEVKPEVTIVEQPKEVKKYSALRNRK